MKLCTSDPGDCPMQGDRVDGEMLCLHDGDCAGQVEEDEGEETGKAPLYISPTKWLLNWLMPELFGGGK